MRRRAHAKLNLFLEVLGKRPDGFHEIVTVMHRVSLCDVMTFEPLADGFEIACSDASVPVDERNLVWKALSVARAVSGRRFGCRVRIEKRIPPGSGLGGGSSNAAQTLLAANELFGLNLSRAELHEAAASIGSDVPFFLNGPLAVCRGRGERVEPAASRLKFWFVLALPKARLSTREVYGRLDATLTPCKQDVTVFLNSLAGGDVEEIGERLFNRLEEPAFAMRPELREWSREMLELGACGSLMSGSGSALFALCRGPEHAEALASALSKSVAGRVLPVVSDTS